MVMVNLSGKHIAVCWAEPVHSPVHDVPDAGVPGGLGAEGVPGHEVCHSRTVLHTSKLGHLQGRGARMEGRGGEGSEDGGRGVRMEGGE